MKSSVPKVTYLSKTIKGRLISLLVLILMHLVLCYFLTTIKKKEMCVYDTFFTDCFPLGFTIMDTKILWKSFFFKNGCDIFPKDSNGKTAWNVAVNCIREETAKLLKIVYLIKIKFRWLQVHKVILEVRTLYFSRLKSYR